VTSPNARASALGSTPVGSAQFRAVIGASLLIMVGFGLIIPALPLFADRFGVGEAGVGLVLTAFSLTRLFGDFFAAGLIDRHGERMITAIGVVIVGVSSIAAGAAGSFTQLVVLRGFGGVGSAFFLGGLMAYLIGTVPANQRGRAMSAFQAAIGIGLLIGPLLGGVIIGTVSVNAPLYVYGAVCLAVAPLVLRAMSGARVPSEGLADAPAIEEAVPAPASRAWSRIKPLAGNSTYRAALAVSGVAFLATGALQALIPTYWRDVLGRSEASSGVPFTVMALTAILVVWHAGGLSDRRGRKFTLVPSLAATAFAVAGLAFFEDAVVLVALMAVFGLASGYARPGPTAMVADVAPQSARGVAVSGYRIAGDVGALIGPYDRRVRRLLGGIRRRRGLCGGRLRHDPVRRGNRPRRPHGRLSPWRCSASSSTSTRLPRASGICSSIGKALPNGWWTRRPSKCSRTDAKASERACAPSPGSQASSPSPTSWKSPAGNRDA
jgi:MFS family permease